MDLKLGCITVTENNSSTLRDVIGRELIALIRESFAFSDPVSLLADNLRFSAEITSFDDDDTRAIDQERFLELLVPSSELEYSISKRESCLVEIISKRFKLSFKAKIVKVINGSVTIQIPTVGTVGNVRRSERILVKDQNFFDGIIVSNTQLHPCLVQFIDVAAGTIGAKLFSDIPLDLIEMPVLHTQIKNKDLEFNGSANIIRIHQVTKGHNHFEYVVGLEPTTATKGSETVSRASRVVLSTSLHCTIESTNSQIVFDIIDVSLTGFRASKSTPTLTWLTQGIAIKENSTGLKFTIARRELDGSLGAKLCADRPEEKIRWSNFILPMIRAGKVSASADDARGLVNVFLEAGGSIADNLSYKRHAVTQASTLSVLTNQTDVLLRWVNVSEGGLVLGHHSSYRIGLNSWFTGDIVGGQAKHKKIDSNFIKNNFYTFKEILTTIKEPQMVFGSWKFGHPYWQKWRDFLIQGNHLIFLEKYDHISRTALRTSIPRKQMDKITFINLLSLGSKGIEKTISSFDDSPLKRLLGALDVTSSGVFFNGIESLYTSGGMNGFRREVYLAQRDNLSVLVLFSQLPNGVSINGVFDTVFIFPLNCEEKLSLEEKNDFYSCITIFALGKGIRVASVRSFFDPDDCIGTQTELVVLRPEGLEFFCE